MTGEAQDLGPRYITAEDLTSDHVLVKQLEALVQVAEQMTTEFVQSSGAESNSDKEEMVTRRALTVDRFVLELKIKLGGTELKLAKAESLSLAQAEEVSILKATLEACENKWCNEGFADMENSVEPVICQAQRLSFGEGWLATLQAMGVPKDSPLRNPSQIPFSDPTSPV
nr:hypothetical protein CFP56_73534 [Quercus suber]